MTRQVLYVAHPVAPTNGDMASVPYKRVEPSRNEYENDVHIPIPDSERVALAVRANLERAMRWLAWLRKSFPETTFIAPWIADIQAAGDDADPDPSQREAGLVDCCAVVERCDGIVLCGGRISSGMRREMEHGVDRNTKYRPIQIMYEGMTLTFKVYDLTGLGAEPPLHLCNLSRGGLHSNAFAWAGFEVERGLICLSRMGLG